MTLLRHKDLRLQLKINSHWIFSDIAHSLCSNQPSTFLLGCEDSSNVIDPLVGLSPRLLNIYVSVTWELLKANTTEVQGPVLHERLTEVNQYMSCLDDLFSWECKILEDCTTAYLHEAYIYVLCHYEQLDGFIIASYSANSHFRQSASDSMIQQHQNKLWLLLNSEVLLLSGNLFWAVWSLVPAFIFCVTCSDQEERHTL